MFTPLAEPAGQLHFRENRFQHKLRSLSCTFPVSCLYSFTISQTALSRPSDVRCISVSACSISDIQHSTARSTPTDISLAITFTRSVGIAVVAKKLPAFLNPSNETLTQEEGTPSVPPPSPAVGLLTRRCFRVSSLILHSLLEPLFPLGNELSQLGFLIRGQNLVRLVSDARVLHFKLRMNLRSLGCNCLRLRLIKGATLDERHHLFMGLHFLLEQRFQRGLLFGDDLFDLRLLRIREIQVIAEETHHRPAKEITTARPAVGLGYRNSRHQDDSQRCNRHLTAKFHNLSCEHSP